METRTQSSLFNLSVIMENMVKIKGYHTCKVDGGWRHILKNAPFISEPNNRQWLTQGYYFWTDSNHFAHKP